MTQQAVIATISQCLSELVELSEEKMIDQSLKDLESLKIFCTERRSEGFGRFIEPLNDFISLGYMIDRQMLISISEATVKQRFGEAYLKKDITYDESSDILSNIYLEKIIRAFNEIIKIANLAGIGEVDFEKKYVKVFRGNLEKSLPKKYAKQALKTLEMLCNSQKNNRATNLYYYYSIALKNFQR